MAKLSDLVNIGINKDVIKIQDAEIPISFGMDAMEYIAEAFGGDYAFFEEEFNEAMGQGSVALTPSSLKLGRALIYGLVRSGGTECTPQELNASIPISQIPDIFEKCLDVFNNQNFQGEDLKKSQKPQDFQKKKNNNNYQKKKNYQNKNSQRKNPKK